MRSEAQVPQAQKIYYEELFQIADADKDGVIGLSDASFFRNSLLSNDILRDIWQLSDVNNGYLNIEDFFVALKLVSLAQMGAPVTLDSIKLIPVIPPPKLNDIPPLTNDWVIGSSEKQNYIDLFKKYDEDSDGYILGGQAKTIFGTSGLPTKMLSHIWNLSDVNKDQKLDCQEFIMATFLIRSVLKGYELPNKLPESLITSSHYISSAGVPSPKIPDWLIPPAERIIYEDLFHKNQQGGIFTGSQAKVLFEKSGLSNQDLKLIWDLSDYNQEQVLDKHKFVIAMFLIAQRKKGKELPLTLPQVLLDSSKSNFNPSSISSPPPSSSSSSSSQQQSQQSPSTQSSSSDSKYNINLNELVTNNISIGQPQPQSQTTIPPATASGGGLNVSGLIPPPQSQSPTIGNSSPTSLTRESSFTFDNNSNLLAKPPQAKPNTMTRMNSFQQVSPQSTVSSVGSIGFTTAPAVTSSPQSTILSNNTPNATLTTTNTTTTGSTMTSPTTSNITQLFENIEKVKQQVFEQERIRQEEIQNKLNQELQLENELRQQLSQEQKQLDEIKEIVRQEETRLSTIKQDNQSLKEQIASTRIEIKSLKAQSDQVSSLVREKSEHYEEQKEALTLLTDDLREKQQELEKNKQQIDQLLQSIESIKQSRIDVKNQLSLVNKELADNKNEIKQLQDEQKQEKQKLQDEQKQLLQSQQQQQIQQQTFKSTITTVKSDDNISFTTTNNNNNNTTATATGGNDQWDFFSSMPAQTKSSTSLPTSPFDDKTFVSPPPPPTTTTTTNTTINSSNNSLTFNNSQPTAFNPQQSLSSSSSSNSPIKTTITNQLKLSNSSVGGAAGSVASRKLSGASVSSNNSFNDNTSIDTLNNHFGSDQFSFNSFGSSNTNLSMKTQPSSTTTINNTTTTTTTTTTAAALKDPFGDSNSNPFGEESTSSFRDGGSETLSEAHTLFDKDPLFETNDAFSTSKDPFGQILFSNFSKDSFGGESGSINNNNNNSINSNNRQSTSSPIDNDLFSNSIPPPSQSNNQSFTSNNDSFDFQNTSNDNGFGVKFNDSPFDGFEVQTNITTTTTNTNTINSIDDDNKPKSDPFKDDFGDFGSAPFSFGNNKFNDVVVGDDSPSLDSTNNTLDNNSFSFNNTNSAPSPFDD